ncbi:FAD:protein FMN transferase [Pseudophaeobacter flagellatus]|uniref:FAD:protein FMN transferase n=1 Tax=Pseudophaeobacter flagellatus TaxID=2899119 RepID=UPI001E34B946|nr:FAD:protein FMN transferase [Pseudophaeobacter flagellatus]MCD9149704.1 FAD:protein FMN transferase [Pseudophaeobacter flagellatus]
MARLFLVALMVLLAACKSDPVTLTFSGETMGTTYNIIAVDKTAALSPDVVQDAITQALDQVNAQMSNWDPRSEISRFNAAAVTDPIEISPELAKVMRAATEIHRKSEKLFDVTLGPLIEIWGFGARNANSPVPSDATIQAALAMVGQDKILSLSAAPNSLRKSLPETSVYLAAIAKGYGVDQVAAALQAAGLRDYMVEIGGDLVTAGQNPNGASWRIGIERPDAAAQTIEEILDVSGLGMATSGDYRNYFEQDGIRYSHIIDAVTGRPITHGTASVTVLADSAMMADGWATALLALGQDRGLPIAEAEGLAVLFIARQPDSGETGFEITVSTQFAKLQAEQ